VIQKISSPGSGFRGLLNYALGPKKSPEMVAGNMAGENARDLASEFGDARAANAAVSKPVFHGSLSADPGDKVTADQWRAIAEAYVERMGYGDSLWVAVRHRDTDHDHVHIIASRVSHDGTRVQDHQERKRGERILRDLERDHGLREVLPSKAAARAAITRDELSAFERSGEVSIKARLQEHLDVAVRNRPTMQEFAQRLEAQGVAVRIHVASTGRVSGISYELDGVAVKGSSVGRSYSWRGLQERHGVSYEPARDLPTLLDAASRPSPLREATALPTPAAPMPPLERPARDYRQAAQVVVRMDLHERSEALSAQIATLAAPLFAARTMAEQREWAERRLAATEQQVFGFLKSAYQNPVDAQERLRELVDRQGYRTAAETLERAPAELGKLRGLGIGKLANKPRQEALQIVASTARELREVGIQRDRAMRDAPPVLTGSSQLQQAARQRDFLVAMRGRLPSLFDIQKELSRAAQVLGIAVVQSVSAKAAHLAVQFAKRMARSIGSGRDDGLGR
jgi:hypothetical protein